MYLHLGDNQMVAGQDVIMVLNLAELRRAAGSAKFYARIALDIEGAPLYPPESKSVVVTSKGVYFSLISAATLLKRAAGNLYLSEK